MKILHVSHTNISTDSRILKEIDALRSLLGAEVIGWCISKDGIASQGIRSIKYQPNFIKGMPSFVQKTVKAIWRLVVFTRLVLSSVGTRANIVHCHDWYMLPIGVLHKLIWSSQIVYDAHELESDTNTTSKLRKRTASWVERFSWSWIDGFITVSGSILGWYNDEFGEKEINAVVLNSPIVLASGSDKKVQKRLVDLRQTLGISNEKSLGIYVGGFETGRGIELTLEAVSQIQDETHFLFLGYGSAEEKFKNLAKELGCSNVTFLERIPHDQVVDFISACDYGVCLIEEVSLSDIYCLPNKLFEYAHAGLHILGSNLPEISKFLESTGLGDVLELNSAELRQKIVETDFSMAKRKSTLPPEQYGWPAQVKHLLNLYEKVLLANSRN